MKVVLKIITAIQSEILYKVASEVVDETKNNNTLSMMHYVVYTFFLTVNRPTPHP